MLEKEEKIMKEMSAETTLNYIISICKNNIVRIDRLSENGIATDVDIGMAYVYRKILGEINNETD